MVLTAFSLWTWCAIAATADTNRAISLFYDFAQPQVGIREGRTRVTVSGCENLTHVGEAPLPFRTARILLPPGFKVEKVVTQPGQPPVILPGTWQLEPGHRLASPWRPDGRVAETGTRVPTEVPRAFSSAFRPLAPAQLVSVQRMLGCDIALVRLFPVEYQAANGQLRFSAQLNVTLTLSATGAKPAISFPTRGQASARARVASWVDNPALLSEYQMTQAAIAPDAPSTHDYLLVTRSSLVPSFQALVEQKTRDGLSVRVETMEAITAAQPGRDAPEKLRNYIRYACTNWGVQYVLLGGDVATVPCRHAYVRANENEAECYLPTDAYYACLDGSWNRDGDNRWGEPTDGDQGGDVDLLAEVWVGRAPVDTADEAANFVVKTTRYEQQGNRNCRSILLAAEYLGRYAPDIAAQGGDMFDPLLPRLRQWVVSWLDDRPHTTPQWDSRQAIRALNDAPHFVCYNGHGESDAMMRLKSSDVGALTNEDLFLAYSVSCHAGRFDNDPFSPDSIAEELVKLPRHGAFAAIFNARVGWFDPRQVWKYSGEYQIKFFEQLLHKGQTNLGKACQLSKHDLLGQVETTGVMAYRWCYFQINLLGDPHTPVRITDMGKAGQPAAADSKTAAPPPPQAGLLLPVLSRPKEPARTTQCLSQMLQVGLGVRLYADDHDHEFPRTHRPDFAHSQFARDQTLPPQLAHDIATWTNLLRGVSHCPSDRRTTPCSRGEIACFELNPENEDHTGSPQNWWRRVASLPHPSATMLQVETPDDVDRVGAHDWMTSQNPSDVDTRWPQRPFNYHFVGGNPDVPAFRSTFDPSHRVDLWNPSLAQ